jgi:uncharacterized protein (DUF362 family)
MTFTVSIQRCTSYERSAVRQAVELAMRPFGGFESIIVKDDRVLLKPNLLFAKPAEKAVTTHPAIIEAVGEMALDCGARVYLGDSPPLPSARRVVRACGIEEVVNRLGIEVVEFTVPGTKPRRAQVRTQGIATPLLDESLSGYDKIINLPKLKAHQQMMLTCAIKNLYGCVNGRKKAYWHFRLRHSPEAFAEMLLAVYEKIVPEITIVDAVVAMQGRGPGSGTPYSSNLILAGTDPIAIDRVVTEITGVASEDHFVIEAAQKLGFPSSHLHSICIEGLSLPEAALPHFEKPEVTPIGFSFVHIVKGLCRHAMQIFRNRKGRV